MKMIQASQFPEPEYRKKIQEVYDTIEKALADVDPDVAECEQASGVLTITFGDRTRCILSGQPSVRQLWVALAAIGTAYHFDYDFASGRWVDDKGRGIELMSYMQKFLTEKTGEKISLPA
jgi:CyaY protein